MERHWKTGSTPGPTIQHRRPHALPGSCRRPGLDLDWNWKERNCQRQVLACLCSKLSEVACVRSRRSLPAYTFYLPCVPTQLRYQGERASACHFWTPVAHIYEYAHHRLSQPRSNYQQRLFTNFTLPCAVAPAGALFYCPGVSPVHYSTYPTQSPGSALSHTVPQCEATSASLADESHRLIVGGSCFPTFSTNSASVIVHPSLHLFRQLSPRGTTTEINIHRVFLLVPPSLLFHSRPCACLRYSPNRYSDAQSTPSTHVPSSRRILAAPTSRTKYPA